MSEFFFYKGLYKVKVLTKTEGYWIVEAQEPFEDYLNDRKIDVRIGEQRIVEPSALHRKKVLAPPIPEHVYERKLEQKVKRLVDQYDHEKGSK